MGTALTLLVTMLVPFVSFSSFSYLFLQIDTCIVNIQNHHNRANRGETWTDLHLNNVIMVQTHTTWLQYEDIQMLGWEREMMDRVIDPEVHMVSGERAFQAARLFALRNHKVIIRSHHSMEELRDWVDEVNVSQ